MRFTAMIFAEPLLLHQTLRVAPWWNTVRSVGSHLFLSVVAIYSVSG